MDKRVCLSDLTETDIAMDDDSMTSNYRAKKKYSAKDNVKNISFFCLAPEAKTVFLVGDFNDWEPRSHPMKKQVDGSWTLDISLSHGAHHYLFRIDGQLTLDPRARGIARNEKNERVSLVMVS